MAGISTVATMCFFFVRKPDRVARLDVKLEGLALVDDSMDRSESTGTDYVERTVNSQIQQNSFADDIRSVLNLLVSKRMLPILPQVAWTGVSISVYTGMLVPIMSNTLHKTKEPEEIFELTMFAMVTLGAGEIVGAIGMGFIVDHIGAKKSCFINVILIILPTLCILAFIQVNEFNWMAYLMAFLWGLQDSSISIHLDAILGFEFESNKEPFSCDVLVESITAFSIEIA